MSVAPPPGAPLRVSFPHQDDFARIFFAEAVRHLHDACVLHQADRYAASITSAQKAAELAVKAGLVLDGSLGWWEKLQQTHQPLVSIKSHAVLKHHYEELASYDAQLTVDVILLEKLAPSRPDGKNLQFDEQLNTEYPFFYLNDSPGAAVTSHLVAPSDYFEEAHSLKHYRTARGLLTAYQMLHQKMKDWEDDLPAAL